LRETPKKEMEHTVELEYGYTDKKGVVHKSITLGKRPTLQGLLDLDNSPLSRSSTQHQRLIWLLTITKFGDLKAPFPITPLLALDTVDDDKLSQAVDAFLRESRDGRDGQINGAEAVLMFPLEIEGVPYDTIRFGNRLTVKDYVDADAQGLDEGIAREAYKVGRQIKELASSDTGVTREGQLTLKDLGPMDAEDFTLVRLAAEFFRIRNPQMGGEAVGAPENDSLGSKADGVE
jgi:hypothetical protein